MTVQEQKTIQKRLSVAEVYKQLKHDLKLCINFLETWQEKYVVMYFWTNKRSEIEKQINVIIQDFPEKRVKDIQKLMLKIFTYFTKPNGETTKDISD